MRKFSIALVAVLGLGFMSSVATAGNLRDNIGCGVGTILFDGTGNSNGGWLLQSLALWTNQILSNTFSMTTGTVGCKGAISRVVNYEKAYEFVTENIDDLAKDAAVGAGETIESLATLLEVTDVAAFGQNIQDHFAEIFPDANVESVDVLVKIVEINS